LEASASADIGEICLKIWRKELLGQDEKYNSPPAEQKIHERAKKATAHRVKYVFINPSLEIICSWVCMHARLGDDVQRPYRKCIRAKTLDKDPLVTFVFKYRPLGAHVLFLRCLIYLLTVTQTSSEPTASFLPM
jgi:hypothetical protein